MIEQTEVTTVDQPNQLDQLRALVNMAMGAVGIGARGQEANGTTQQYKRVLHRYVDWLEEKAKEPEPQAEAEDAVPLPVAINAESLRAYLKAATPPLTPGMQYTTVAAVRRLVKEAVAMGVGIDQETVDELRRVKPAKAPPKGPRVGTWLTQEQLVAWLNGVNAKRANSPVWLRNAALLGLVVGCGLRRSEAVRVRERDLRRVEGRWVVDVVYGKGGKRRAIAIPDWAWAWIEDWLKVLPGRKVERIKTCMPVLREVYGAGWARPKDTKVSVGTSLSSSGLAVALKRIQKEVPVKDADGRVLDLNPHDMRRTWAVLGLRNGAAIDLIQRGLGHSNLETTQIYLRAAEDLRPGKGASDYLLRGVMMEPEFWDKIEARTGRVGDVEREKWRVIMEACEREEKSENE